MSDDLQAPLRLASLSLLVYALLLALRLMPHDCYRRQCCCVKHDERTVIWTIILLSIIEVLLHFGILLVLNSTVLNDWAYTCGQLESLIPSCWKVYKLRDEQVEIRATDYHIDTSKTDLWQVVWYSFCYKNVNCMTAASIHILIYWIGLNNKCSSRFHTHFVFVCNHNETDYSNSTIRIKLGLSSSHIL